MNNRRGWASYPITYCSREMSQLAGWIQAGDSGAVVGPAGVGKSNLLGFLCRRPDALALYLDAAARPISLIFVDLNDLPALDPATLYRVIIRAIYESRQQLSPPLLESVAGAYHETRTNSDPFTIQTSLRELLHAFHEQSLQVVLALDRFDHYCQIAPQLMLDTLRALRDSFKDTLSYLVGMRRDIAYLSDPALLGELYEILDVHVCRVRPLTTEDARHLAARELSVAPRPPDSALIDRLIYLTGGYPAWLKIACSWWMTSPALPPAEWTPALLAEHTIQYRLTDLWVSLSQVEQRVLSEVAGGMDTSAAAQSISARHAKKTRSTADEPLIWQEQIKQPLALLEAKGLIQNEAGQWRIFCPLLADYIAGLPGSGRGQIWLDQSAGDIYQGQSVLENLAPLERSLLSYLVAHPRIRHTYTAIIQAAWPGEVNKEGVSNEALFQVITGLRRKIEPDPAHPCYLVNWRGIPEGGYQCFPEGRPG